MREPDDTDMMTYHDDAHGYDEEAHHVLAHENDDTTLGYALPPRSVVQVLLLLALLTLLAALFVFVVLPSIEAWLHPPPPPTLPPASHA